MKVYWVEYNYVDGKAMNMRVFSDEAKANDFAKEVGGKVF